MTTTIKEHSRSETINYTVTIEFEGKIYWFTVVRYIAKYYDRIANCFTDTEDENYRYLKRSEKMMLEEEAESVVRKLIQEEKSPKK